MLKSTAVVWYIQINSLTSQRVGYRRNAEVRRRNVSQGLGRVNSTPSRLGAWSATNNHNIWINPPSPTKFRSPSVGYRTTSVAV